MGEILYNIIIRPLEFFIEFVFSSMYMLFQVEGIAIIFVSIAVQLLCFPLYKRADDIQEQERLKQKEMERWVTHIKNTFKGDERFMMQQAYYREVGYKPIYAIKGSISLLLQIPFFIAAYNFLSTLDCLKGASFLGIPDLSAPDGLIKLGAVSINLLPVLMTLFNVISGIIYTKGFPLKDKIQTYGLAAIFLVILYKSPSGLVFYWTLNNFFSLFKNVILKVVKNTKRFLSIVLAITGAVLPFYLLTVRVKLIKIYIGIIVISIICFIPVIVYVINSKKKKSAVPEVKKELFGEMDIRLVNAVFYLSIGVLLLLLGLLIPVDVIKTSPVEFRSANYGPFGLIFNTFTIHAGFLFVWLTTFYVFSAPKARKVFSFITSICAVAGVIDYLFFARNLGTMSTCFVYDKVPSYSSGEMLLNFLIVFIAAVIVYVVYGKKAELIKRLNQILALAISVMIVMGSVSIKKTYDFELQEEDSKVQNIQTAPGEISKALNLSKNGKNVIVFMLDRAISGYLPFILEDKPELKEMLDGFTYYPNTVSFGGYTNFATPALFGGYEYTPTELNSRSDEALKSKHNEAITMLPRLFSENGFTVNVVDPPYAGYKWVSDLSIYKKYKGVKASKAAGKYSAEAMNDYIPLFEPTQKRSAVFYGLMRATPVLAQKGVYQSGYYWAISPFVDSVQTFLDEYTVLQNLDEMTAISESGNTFNMIQNASTHEPMLFDDDYDMPDERSIAGYIPSREKDGVTMDLFRKVQVSHYQTNIAALLRVGEWLDFLKEQGVYDNTKIIIVSDHGRNLEQFSTMNIIDGLDIEMYNPLLLVKDFDAKGFKTSDEFMTNADTPTIAVSNVIDNPVNPFTGKVINNSEKTAHPQRLTTSGKFNVSTNNGNQFDTSDGEWWTVEKNIFDKKNWKKVGG